MQITTDVTTMKKALAVIKPGVAKRGPLLALTGARFEAKNGKVTVTGSDLDLTIQTDVPATVVEDGIAIVPFTQLTKLLKGKGSLELKTRDRNIAIQNGSLSTLQTLPAEEFMRMPDSPAGNGIPLDLRDLASVIGAASKDEARPILTGVLFRGTEIVTTDSYRLHRVIDPAADYPELLVPAACLAAVVKHGAPAFLHVGPTHTATRKKTNGEPPWITDGQPSHYRRQYGDNQSTPNPAFKDWDESYEQASDSVSITSGSTTWFSRLIEGEFPNYASLFPKSYPHSLTFGRDEMLAVVASLKPMCLDASPVRFNLTHGESTLKLRVIVQDVGEASGEVALSKPFDGPDSLVAFNPDFFAAAVAVSKSDRVSFSFLDGLKPSLMTEDVKPSLMTEDVDGRTSDRLLMPVRVS